MNKFAHLDQEDQAHLRHIGQANGPVPFGDPWPDPDMSVIWPERPKAPEMSEGEFSTVFGRWAEWLRSAASVKNVHPDYVALALLSAASAVIGNTRHK